MKSIFSSFFVFLTHFSSFLKKERNSRTCAPFLNTILPCNRLSSDMWCWTWNFNKCYNIETMLVRSASACQTTLNLCLLHDRWWWWFSYGKTVFLRTSFAICADFVSSKTKDPLRYQHSEHQQSICTNVTPKIDLRRSRHKLKITQPECEMNEVKWQFCCSILCYFSEMLIKKKHFNKISLANKLEFLFMWILCMMAIYF